MPRRAVPVGHASPSSPSHRRPIALLIGLLVLTSLGAAVAVPPRVVWAAPAVTAAPLNLRSGPGIGNPVLLVMPAGSTVEVTGATEAGFAPVVYAGTSGWASVDFLGGGAPDGGAPPSGNAGAAGVATELNLRAGPSTSDAVLAVMPAGAMVTLTGQASNGFAGVVYNGTTGWAFAAYLGAGEPTPTPNPAPDPAPAPGPTGGARTTTSLNLRGGPSTGDAVLAVMPAGASVTLTGQASNGFAGVVYNGTTGWAFAAYLGDAAAPAPTPTPAPNPNPAPAPAPGPSGTAYTTVALNLREAPSSGARIITVMPAGGSVTLTGRAQDGFQEVVFFGQTGWAAAAFLGSGGTPPTPPGNSGTTTDQIVQIIYAAADRYGQPREDMLRVAKCESNLDPNAVNVAGSSYGLFQFIRSTWATTPYANEDIFDATASANAAGWMWSVGRRNEWVCQ